MSYPNPLSELLREPNLLVPRKKPTGHVAIDRRHPLAQGLVGAYLFDSLRCTNLVNGVGAVSMTGTPTVEGDKMNFGTRTDNFSFYLGTDGTPYTLAGKRLGMVVGYQCPNIVSATDENVPISSWSSTGTSGYLLRYRADSQRWELYIQPTGTAISLVSGTNTCTRASMADFSVIGATYGDDSIARIFQPDGVTTTSSTASSGPLAAYDEGIYIGDTAHNTTDYWVDFLHFIYLWERPITKDEVDLIRLDPYQMVVPA